MKFFFGVATAFLLALSGCGDSSTGTSDFDRSSDSTQSGSSTTTQSSSTVPVAITVDCGPSGTCSPGDTTVFKGAQVNFVFKASEGFALDSVSMNDSLYFLADTTKSFYGSYRFTYGNIQSAIQFKVRFKKLPQGLSSTTNGSSSSAALVPITVDCGAGGTCTPGDTAVTPGSNLKILFKADNDKMVSQVKMDGVEYFKSDTTKTIYATFTSSLENIHKPRAFWVRFKKRS